MTKDLKIRHRLGQKTKQKKQQTKTKVDQRKLFATGNIGDKAKSIQTRQITEQKHNPKSNTTPTRRNDTTARVETDTKRQKQKQDQTLTPPPPPPTLLRVDISSYNW